MSDPYRHDPYGERRRYLSQSGSGTWVLGGFLAMAVVFGLIFALAGRTGPDQTASNIQSPAATQQPAPTTGSTTVPIGQSRPAETTGSGTTQR